MTQATLDARANFYPDTTGMRLLRLSFATIQKLWPALAVRAAYRLFGTPLPPKWAARRHAWRAEWQPDSLPFEDASITLHTRPDFANAHAPMVVLVHGWGGHAGQMLALGRMPCAAQGLAARAGGDAGPWPKRRPQPATCRSLHVCSSM
jgi:hypothetical protein